MLPEYIGTIVVRHFCLPAVDGNCGGFPIQLCFKFYVAVNQRLQNSNWKKMADKYGGERGDDKGTQETTQKGIYERI
jgi:hypothetical protein